MNGILFVPLLLLASPARGELTPEEYEMVGVCKANISEEEYSPKIAEKCVKRDLFPDTPLYAKLKTEQPGELHYALKYNGVFMELGDFFRDKPSQCIIRKRLLDLLELSSHQNACALCDVGMAPNPENVLVWVGKYYSASLAPAESAALSWKIAGEPRSEMLSKIGVARARWEQLSISARIAVAMAETSISGRANSSDRILECGTIDSSPEGYMNKHMPPDILTGIRTYISGIKPNPSAGVKPSVGSRGYAGAKEKIGNLAGKTDAEILASLGRAFDNKGPEVTGPALKVIPPAGRAKDRYELPDEKLRLIAEELKIRMLGGVSALDGKPRKAAFSGTPWEEAALAYYTEKDGRGKPLHGLNLKVMNLGDKMGGGYCSKLYGSEGCGNGIGAGDVVIGKMMVEAWMEDNHITARQLTTNPKFMDRLGRNFYTLLVHEAAIHEVWQDQFHIANNIPNKKVLDKEVMAFGASSASLKIKLNGPEGALYRKETSDGVMKTLDTFEQGGYRAVKARIRAYDLDGVQGMGAKGFAQLEAGLKELELRRADPRYGAKNRDTGKCSWSDIVDCSSQELARMTQKNYEWYEAAIARQKSDMLLLNSVFDSEINRSAIPRGLKAAKVKELREFNEEEL